MSDFLTNLQDKLGTPAATTTTPVKPKKPGAEPAFVPVESSNGDDYVAASLAFFASDECSDNQRQTAFRGLARQMGIDTRIHWWTPISNSLAIGTLVFFVLAIVKLLIVKDGRVYLIATPAIAGMSGISLLALSIMFRNRVDIVPLLLQGAIGIILAIAVSIVF